MNPPGSVVSLCAGMMCRVNGGKLAPMNNQLVMAAIGTDRPGLVDQVSGWVVDCGCNIADSRMMVMGGEFAILLLVSGTQDSLTKLEGQLVQAQEQLEMSLTLKRTGAKSVASDLVTYVADVVALDHPGIVHKLASFFSQRNINIQDLSTSCYSAAHTGTPMFSVHLKLDVPKDSDTESLCRAFLDCCDRLNLDATIQPVKA